MLYIHSYHTRIFIHFKHPLRPCYIGESSLSLWLLHHLCLLLGESLADSLATSHELGDAAGDTSGLSGDEGLGGEVVDAGVEAAVDQAGEHLQPCQYVGRYDLQEVLRGRKGGRHTPMNSFICLRSMRCWNSRCSLALRPSLNICRQPRFAVRHRRLSKTGA